MSKIKVTKRPPGSLPYYGALHMGRGCDSHRDLTWKRACKEAEKGGIHLSLTVATAPDRYTPYKYESWEDPRDVRGAMRAARAAVESGEAQYAHVTATAQRHYYPQCGPGGKATWDLGGFEVAEEETS